MLAVNRTQPLLAIIAIGFSIGITFHPRPSFGQVKCVKAASKQVRGLGIVTSLSTATRIGTCKKGEVVALAGPAGESGPAGADGQLRVYGDGSAGNKQIDSGLSFIFEPNAMYTNFTVASGSTLSMETGAIIRCTGSFINNGTIRIGSGALGGSLRAVGTRSSTPSYRPPHPGVSRVAAAAGELGDNSESRLEGLGGEEVVPQMARALLKPELFGGGGGAGGLGAADITKVGGAGGGTLVVLCSGPVINNGTIVADGEDPEVPSGGGGGGIVVLASRSSVTLGSTSKISVEGGNGGNGTNDTGPSGGGGGGIVHLLAPAITASEQNVSVQGGEPGAVATVTATVRSGGHGGGACGGAGGQGGLVVAPTNFVFAATKGNNGRFITSNVDPTSLF